MKKKRIVRYLFFGGCTTIVNLVVFWTLCYIVQLNVQISNVISILTAIVFAFVVNKWFVFERISLEHIGMEFIRFVGMRGITLLVELFGVNILAQYVPAFAGKLFLQFVIIVLNYVISKYFVFQKGGCTNEENQCGNTVF